MSRLEGLSDAVFAFSVTLLVISLEVPKTFPQLLELMKGFLAFGLAFALILYIWYEHYKFFRRYGLEDPLTVTLNGILLFVVIFFVYPLKFLFTYLMTALTGGSLDVVLANGSSVPMLSAGDGGTALIIYGCGYVAVWYSFALLYMRAFAKRSVLELNPLELFDTRTSMRESILNGSVGLASVLVTVTGGAVAIRWSGLIYFLVGPVLGLHGWISGRRRRLLEANLGSQRSQNLRTRQDRARR